MGGTRALYAVLYSPSRLLSSLIYAYLSFFIFFMQHIERPYTIFEEDPQCRKASPVIRVERMFEQIIDKLPDAPDFLLCVLPERKTSDIYGSISVHRPF